MIYCSACGSPNVNTALHCTTCGAPLRVAPPTPPDAAAVAPGLPEDDKRWIFLGNLCLSPVLGLALYLVWKSSHPAKAEDTCKLTWWAVAVWGILIVLGILVTLVAEA
jgi:hypothetical protein